MILNNISDELKKQLNIQPQVDSDSYNRYTIDNLNNILTDIIIHDQSHVKTDLMQYFDILKGFYNQNENKDDATSSILKSRADAVV